MRTVFSEVGKTQKTQNKTGIKRKASHTLERLLNKHYSDFKAVLYSFLTLAMIVSKPSHPFYSIFSLILHSGVAGVLDRFIQVSSSQRSFKVVFYDSLTCYSENCTPAADTLRLAGLLQD